MRVGRGVMFSKALGLLTAAFLLSVTPAQALTFDISNTVVAASKAFLYTSNSVCRWILTVVSPPLRVSPSSASLIPSHIDRVHLCLGR